jgi:hypothetical protein
MEEDQLNATVSALKLINEEMLLFDPKKRTHPRALMYKAFQFLNQVESNLQLRATSGPHDLDAEMRQPSGINHERPINHHSSSAPTPVSLRMTRDMSAPSNGVIDVNPACGAARSWGCESKDDSLQRSYSVQPGELGVASARREALVEQEPHGGARRGTTENSAAGVSVEQTRRLLLAAPLLPSVQQPDSSQYESRPRYTYSHHAQDGMSNAPVTPPQRPRDSAIHTLTGAVESPIDYSEPDYYEEDGTPDSSTRVIQMDMGAMDIASEPPMQSSGQMTALSRTTVPVLNVHDARTWWIEDKRRNIVSKLLKPDIKKHTWYWRQLSQDFEGIDFVSINAQRYYLPD